MIRKGDKPLQQIARRLSEYEVLKDFANKLSKQNKLDVEKMHYKGILTNTRTYESQYKVLATKNFKIDITDNRNNGIMLKAGTVVNVLNIAKSDGKLFIIGKKCIKQKDLYVTCGFSSDNLGIKIVKELDFVKDYSCDLICSKVFKVPCTQGIIIFPMIHTVESFV